MRGACTELAPQRKQPVASLISTTPNARFPAWVAPHHPVRRTITGDLDLPGCGVAECLKVGEVGSPAWRARRAPGLAAGAQPRSQQSPGDPRPLRGRVDAEA